MGNNSNASYVFLKGLPTTLIVMCHWMFRPYYKSDRVILCLKTTRKDQAIRAARSIAQRLEDYWMSLRLANIDVPAFHLLRERASEAISILLYDSVRGSRTLSKAEGCQ